MTTALRVPFYRHGLRAGDAEAVASVLASSFLSAGAVSNQVEEQICRYFNVEAALLGNSWTNLAHATLRALDLGPGDEVVLPAITFVSCANVVELTGATPVLVDVDPTTLLMDFEAVEAALSERTRVVMPVHLYGQMCDMRALRELVKGRCQDIVLIEDCAHAFEALFEGERPGRYGDVSIFSFYGTKNITCGEGGAVIANDAGLVASIRRMLAHGMSAGSFDRFRNPTYQHWDVERPGIHARLPDLLAALLPRQIREADHVRLERQRIDDRYRAELDSSLRRAHNRPEAVSAYHLFPIHVAPAGRDRMISALNAAGIGVTVNFRSIHRLSYYRDRYRIPDARLPASAAWGDGQISLPLFPGLRAEEQDYVIEVVNTLAGRLAAGEL